MGTVEMDANDVWEALDDYVCLNCRSHHKMGELVKVNFCKRCKRRFLRAEVCPKCGYREYVRHGDDNACPDCFSDTARIMVPKKQT